MRIAATVLIGVSLLSGAVIAACSGPASPQYGAVLQVADQDLPLPVVLSDETGLVTSIGSAPLDVAADHGQPTARADPTDPNAFIVGWLGGACDNDASLTFKRHEQGYVLNVAVHGKFSLGCPAVGILRDVRIVTSSPIPVDSIVVAGHT